MAHGTKKFDSTSTTTRQTLRRIPQPRRRIQPQNIFLQIVIAARSKSRVKKCAGGGAVIIVIVVVVVVLNCLAFFPLQWVTTIQEQYQNNNNNNNDSSSSKRPVLIFGVGNGLHNQLMSFVDGMVLATLFQEHYDVVLPTMWGSMGNMSENQSEPMMFGELYDETYFIQCYSSHQQEHSSQKLQIYNEAPLGYHMQKIEYKPSHVGRKINDDNNWNATHMALLEYAQPGIALDLGRFYARWDYDILDTQSFESRRNVIQCLKPAPGIQAVVTKAIEKLHQKTALLVADKQQRAPPDVIAIHPRLESDWKAHCQKHSKLKDCWIDEEEWLARLLHGRRTNPSISTNDGSTTSTTTSIINTTFANNNYIKVTDLPFHNHSSGTITDLSVPTTKNILLLVLGNGAYINRTFFEEKNIITITKNDLLSPKELSVFQYQSSFAAIDFFLGLEAPDMFYGFMLSSMDVMIYESRLYKSLHTATIHGNLGPDWLKLVSTWTKSFFFYRLDDIMCHFFCFNARSLSSCRVNPEGACP